MIRFAYIVALLAVVLLHAASASAQERFPPPDFVETEHELPTTTVPAPRLGVYEYLDVGVLLASLAIASYLVLRHRSRRWIFVLMVFCLAYFGFWRQGCICPVGSLQNVVLALSDSDYSIPLVVLAFFFLPLVFTLFFGRVFCAAVCPLGAIQDVVLLHPVKLPRWLSESLGLLAYVYLGAAVFFAATGAGFVICRYDPFIPLFRLSGSINMLILGACFLVMGMFLGRPYCRFLCPYGALMRMLSRVSRWHATITPDECIECRLCEDSCPFGAINEPNAGEGGQNRREGRGRLAALIILVPVLAVAGGWLVGRAGPVMSRMHPTVRLSDRVWLEDEGEVSDLTDASENFRGSGRVAAELHEEAKEIKAQYVRGGRIFGALLGLLVSVKLISLAVRRKRTDYETDKAHCLSCGRCFSFCPMEHRRLKIIKGLIPKGPLPKKKQEDVL